MSGRPESADIQTNDQRSDQIQRSGPIQRDSSDPRPPHTTMMRGKLSLTRILRRCRKSLICLKRSNACFEILQQSFSRQ